MEPIAVDLKTAASMIGLKRSSVYGLIADGKLDAFKSGRRTLILTSDLHAYVSGLPKAEITYQRGGVR